MRSEGRSLKRQGKGPRSVTEDESDEEISPSTTPTAASTLA